MEKLIELMGMPQFFMGVQTAALFLILYHTQRDNYQSVGYRVGILLIAAGGLFTLINSGIW